MKKIRKLHKKKMDKYILRYYSYFFSAFVGLVYAEVGLRPMVLNHILLKNLSTKLF